MHVLREEFGVQAMDFTTAGEASATIKRLLKKLGVNSSVVRRLSIACYEAEINLVIHSMGGKLILTVGAEDVTLTSEDVGPGIPDIDLAMSEGYSTASEDVRMMGFGAGMALPIWREMQTDFILNPKWEKERGSKWCFRWSISKERKERFKWQKSFTPLNWIRESA